MNISLLVGRLKLMANEITELASHIQQSTVRLHQLDEQIREAKRWRNILRDGSLSDEELNSGLHAPKPVLLSDISQPIQNDITQN